MVDNRFGSSINMKTNHFIRSVLFVGICISPLFIVGCNTQTPAVSPKTSTQKQETAPDPKNTSHPASQVCTDFLHALLHGDDKTLRGLLTPLARKKNEDLGIIFSSSNSLNASFEVHGTTLFDQHGAYVQSTLTDIDDQGKAESAEIVWIVANTPEGWRIAGAAASLFDGQDKTVLNFENPEIAQQAIAEAERLDSERQRENIVQQP